VGDHHRGLAKETLSNREDIVCVAAVEDVDTALRTESTCSRPNRPLQAEVVLDYARNHAAEQQGRWADKERA
jgi:hypothetical protein